MSLGIGWLKIEIGFMCDSPPKTVLKKKAASF
jgi:hypothetical protein